MPTASLRAPEGYHIPSAMLHVSTNNTGVLTKFGGHPCAAGFTADAENLEVIKKELSSELASQGVNLNSTKTAFWDNSTLPTVVQDLAFRKEIILVEESELTTELLAEVMNLDPFGQDFMFPNFLFRFEVKTEQNLKWIGADQNHLKITTKNGLSCTAFSISKDQKKEILIQDSQLWIVAKISQNSWNNTTKLELIADKIIVA
jgi:single-stranded DNA-specific DHH superfamily exonuclease